MTTYHNEFIWDDAVHGETTVCIDYVLHESDEGYPDEVQVLDVTCHVEGIGWARTNGQMEDAIVSWIYGDDGKLSELREDARSD